MNENELMTTEKNKKNLSMNLNKLKDIIQEILKELPLFYEYLNSSNELIQKFLYCIENQKSNEDYINIENLFKDKLLKELDNMFKENEIIYKKSNNSKDLL